MVPRQRLYWIVNKVAAAASMHKAGSWCNLQNFFDNVVMSSNARPVSAKE